MSVMEHPLFTYRDRHGLTQQQLADLFGCSQTLIALIETGERGVSKDKAEAWERITKIPRLTLMYPEEFPLKGRTA